MIWDVDPVLVSIGVVSIRWYGLFLTSALVTAFFYLRWLVSAGNKGEYFDRIILAGFTGGMVGARIGHFLFYETGSFLSSPGILFDFHRPGLSSHGAILGLMLAFLLVSHKQRLPVMWIYARTSMAYILFCVIIRVGNFFNSGIIGKPTAMPWAVTFARIDNLPRHPVQLYESLACIACFSVVSWIFFRTRNNATTFASALISLSLIRLLTEAFKAPQAAIEASLPMSIGQLLTLPLLAFGVGILIVSFRDKEASI